MKGTWMDLRSMSRVVMLCSALSPQVPKATAVNDDAPSDFPVTVEMDGIDLPTPPCPDCQVKVKRSASPGSGRADLVIRLDQAMTADMYVRVSLVDGTQRRAAARPGVELTVHTSTFGLLDGEDWTWQDDVEGVEIIIMTG